MMTEQNTDETCWLQITSGRGPAECQLAVTRLADAIIADAKRRDIAAQIVDAVDGDATDALLSALVKLTGKGAAALAVGYSGTMQWICQSPYRPSHKRKNWYVSVEVLDEPADGALSAIKPADVTFETMRAGGAGGQHVNKTESAVRATHRPSGLVVVAREERSQHMNKRLAMARLAGLLRDAAAGKKAASAQDRWAAHDRIERGDPVRVFEGPQFRERV